MEEISLKEKMILLDNQDKEEKEKKEKVKVKKFKVPRKGVPSKRKLRQGYTIVMRIDDNKNIDFEKVPVEDSTYKLKGGTYHSPEVKHFFTYKGKPFLIQPAKKITPHIPQMGGEHPLEGENQTSGQKYIMARMLKDTIKTKGKGGAGILIWVLVIGAGLFGINYLMGA